MTARHPFRSKSNRKFQFPGSFHKKPMLSRRHSRISGFVGFVSKLPVLYYQQLPGSRVQKKFLAPEIQKNLDSSLTPEELTAVKNKLNALKLKVAAYHVDSLGPDDRKPLDFAKSLGAEVVVTRADTAALPAIDKLANEAGINVAIEN